MEPKQQTIPTPLQQLRGYLIENEYDVPKNEADFPSWVQEEGRLTRLHKLLLEDKEGAEVTPDFSVFQRELLGDVKKKPSGDAGSTPTEQLASPAGALPEGDTEFAAQPQVLPLGYQLPGQPLPTAEQAADAEAARVYAPDFTGPVPAGTYEKPSDKGTAQQGTQYFGEQQPVAAQPEAPDVADDGFWDSFGKSLYNGLDPKRIGGNLLDYGGDLIELLANNTAYDDDGTPLTPINELGKPIRSDKYSDTKGAELLARARATDLPLSQAAQQDGLSSWPGRGNLLGSGIASIVPVAAASAVGGPLAGAGVGGALGISATKDAARAAGIGDEEATVMATVLAPIQAALEAVGVKDPGVSKLAIRATLSEALAAGGGKLTAQALAAAAKKVIPEIGKRALVGGLREGGTELLQGEAEGVAKLVADQVRDPSAPGSYNATVLNDLVKSPLEQAAVGSFLGGWLGTTHGGTQVAPAAGSSPTLTPVVDERLFNYVRPTGQVALRNVQVVALDERTGTATVTGQDAQGNPVRQDVPGGRLFPVKPDQPAPVAAPAAPLEEAGQPEPVTEAPPVAAATPAPELSATVVAAAPEAALLPADAPNAPAAPAATGSEVNSPAPAERTALPDVQPAPASVKPLTPQQQATNDTLDALDRYNALDARATKGKAGSAARAEIATAAQKAGLTATVKADFSMSVTRDGKRATRYNEYTATNPAVNHVSLAERPAEARPFMDAVLGQAEADPRAIQGMGIKVRGKELSARELGGAVEDIRAGKNTMRAQLVLDSLENAYRRGYVEKSEGTGLTTHKFTVPVEEYIGDAAQPTPSERAISDDELHELAAQNPHLAAAIATYTSPETGEIDYASLAEHGGRGALETFFDVSPEVATQAVALANERANSPRPTQPAASRASGPETNGGPAQGRSQPDGLSTRSPGPTPTASPAAREVAPALAQVPDNPAEATGERAHAKRYTDEAQAGLTQEERNYVPSAAKIAANESPAAFIKRAGPEAAYEAAVGEPTTEALLHDNLVRGVAEHYTEARNAALKAGDTATADAAQERIMRLVGALSRSGTEQAQALQARAGAGGTVGDLLRAKDPAATGRATVDAALGEIANRNAEAQQQNDTDAADIVAQAKPKRQRKMAEVLETKTVKAAIEKAAGTSTPPTEAAPADKTGYGDSNKFFTKSKVAEWRKQLKSMAFSAPLPAESILLGAYHLEASTRKFADWSAKMLREAGTRIRPRLAELYELSKAELLKKDPTASGFNTPEEVAAIVGRQQAPGAVQEGVSDLNKRLSDIARQHASDTNTDRRTLTKKFIEDAGLSGRVAGEVAGAIEREWNHRVEKASWQALRGRFQPKRARAKLDALSRLVNDLNAAGNLPETTMRSPVAQLLEQLIGNSVPVTAAEAQHIETLKDAYVKAAKKTARTIGGVAVETQDTKAVAKAALDMLGAIGKLKNVNQQDWTRDLGAMFYASILSNPSTHAANAYLNTIATGHEVGLISTIHTAADAGLAQAAKPLLALFPGYKRGAADAYDVATTGVDLKSKVGDSLSDQDFQSDPLEGHSVVRSRLLAGLQKLGIGRSWQAPEKSAARFVRRALGASDTFFQGGLAEARAKEVAVKTAVRTVERRQASGAAMTTKEVRQFVADETDRLLFNTPEAIADIKAIVASEGLGNPRTLAETAARNARIGDLLDQARAAASPELVADSKEFAARHAGNSEYEGHLGRFAYALADTFKGVPVVGKIIVPFAKVTSNFQNRYAEWAGLGFYRAVQGGAGKPVLGKFGEIDKRFVREYTPEEQEKAFLRSTIGTLVGMSSYALVKAGYIAITGMASGNKDEDQQRPPQSIILLKGPLAGTSFSYKGMNEEIALSTLAQTMSWAEKKHLAGDDPDVTDRMEAVALITAASTMNLGPSNGAGDFLGTISKVNQNPEAWFRAVERMGMTGAKSMLMPAGVTYAANLLNQATDANLPQKQSNDAWQQFKLQVWGDVPSYLGGPDKQVALDIFGDPMKYASNRFWGTRPLNDDPHKAEIKLLLVDKGLMPDEIRISDRRLRLYDPASGNKVTPLTNKEYRDFCEARGQAFYRELTEDGEFRLNDIREAATPKAAAKVRNQALKTATDEARALIENQRAASGAAAEFKGK